MKSIRWSMAIGGLLIAEIILVAAVFAWVAIYSHLLNPGHSRAFYENYAQATGPWLAILAGVPIFYAVCRWIGARSPANAQATVLALFAIYLMIDLPLTVSFENPNITFWFLATNYLMKFLACNFGGRHAARMAARHPPA